MNVARLALLLGLCACLELSPALAAPPPIDRPALVARHAILLTQLRETMPLGNGEFCFNVDGTGLQTFAGSTLSHWAWHSAPLPTGHSEAEVPATGTFETGRLRAPMRTASGNTDLDNWMFRNPHPANLGRLRWVRPDGSALKPEDVEVTGRRYDLWTGLHTARFKVGGKAVTVETCVHPSLDLVAVRAQSVLFEQGELAVAIDFPYPSASNENPWVGDWNRPERHRSELANSGAHTAVIRRQADATRWQVNLGWQGEASLVQSNHQFVLRTSRADTLELVCGFSAGESPTLPGAAETRQAAAERWQQFWNRGGAIDLSQSRDPRWKELERRIVLSQYLMAAQSAGSWPSAETGLMGIDFWSGQFHMEMVWWHLAHYALWDRWEMAGKALTCYQKFLPVATQLAKQFEYRGAKWGKQVGPEGRTAPWEGSFLLHWQQPHPIFFAELDYRLHPVPATLEKWKEVVFASAEYLADFPRVGPDGRRHLEPIMPPSEQGFTKDTVFDLAYWRWGLDNAQRWRERLGLDRDPAWDTVRRELAPLPVVNGVYVHSAEWHDTYSRRAWEHPDPVGVLGLLPPLEGVDPQVARRTVRKVWQTWNWERCWGWDFPWMAMAAARVGEPEIAVEALLKEAKEKNRYDARGANLGGPCPYLPGNGGLLYAVAMMAAGWDGAPTNHAPGFPRNGKWVVRWEGLKPAP